MVGLTGALAAWLLVAPTGWSTPASAAHAAADQQQQSLLLVLDSSGSMKESAGGGKTRFQAAVKAMNTVIGQLPAGLDVGLRVYGAEIADGPGSCKDSRLAVPVGPLDRQALRKGVNQARPKGNTPIAYSLRQAAKDLPGQGQRTIVLVSDGEESCGGDPCAVARDLSQQGLDLRVDVVGFQVTGDARDQLTCIAQAGRGTYYDAPDASALTSQLERLSARAARDYQAAGTPVEGTPTADGAPELGPGQYLDTIGDGDNTETYRIGLPPAATLHAAATIRPTTPGITDTERISIEVSGSEGSCASQSLGSVGGFNVLTPVTAWLSAGAEELDGCGQSPYTVSVTRDDGSGVKPLEVTLVEEPAVANADQLPQPAESGTYDAKAAVSGRTRRAVGAPSFSAAPVLQPGTYKDSILVGETLIYAAELDWGQQLVCDATYAPNKAVDQALGFTEPPAKVKLFGPTRGEIIDFAEETAVTYSGSRSVTDHVAGVPVRYLNREGELFQQSASIPGTYYCATFLNDEPGQVSGEVPLTVTLDVVGEATEGPDYVDAAADPTQTAAPSPAGGDSVAGSKHTANGGDDPAAGLLPWALGLLVLLAAAALGLLVYRRRSSEGSN